MHTSRINPLVHSPLPFVNCTYCGCHLNLLITLFFCSHILDDDFFTLWKKDKTNTSYMLCSVVVFFLLGISFVFVMDYAIAISGKLFNLAVGKHDAHGNAIHADDDDDVKENLLSEYQYQKVPLRDGPEI